MKSKFILFYLTFILISSCTKTVVEKERSFNENLSDPGEIETTSLAWHPTFKYLGAGYDVTEEYAVVTSVKRQVIDLDLLMSNIPNAIHNPDLNLAISNSRGGQDALEYSQELTSKVTGSSTVNIPFFGNSISSTFSGSRTSSNKYNAEYIYSSFDHDVKLKLFDISALTLNQLKSNLKTEFLNDLNSLTPSQLINKYGTHVLIKFDIGGKLRLNFQGRTVHQQRKEIAQYEVSQGAKDIFNLGSGGSNSTTNSNKVSNYTLAYKTHGGNPAFGLIGSITLGQPTTQISLTSWQNSININNAVLVDIYQNGLIPIQDLIDDPIKKEEIRGFIEQYLLTRAPQLEDIPVPVYRFYNPSRVKHFYTITPGSYPGYSSELIAFSAFNYAARNTVPIYRYYNPSTRQHFYTQSPNAPIGFISEGFEFYAYPVPMPSTQPVHRYYNSRQINHFYFKSNNPQSFSGYNYEGIAFYAL